MRRIGASLLIGSRKSPPNNEPAEVWGFVRSRHKARRRGIFRLVRVALAQINTTVGDVWGNAEKAASALERATEAGAQLVALPELTVTGYPPEDLLMRPSFITPAP